MKPDNKKLERLLRKIARGQEVSEQELLAHWQEYEVLRFFNKNREAFLAWTSDKPRMAERTGALENAIARAKTETDLQVVSQDPLLFAAAVELHEQSGDAAFLTALLESRQDQIVRKALYRLKQKGVADEETEAARPFTRELFVFAENRLARWQPLFYFRSHSAFAETGDLFVLQLEEGRDFGIAEQRRDIQINSTQLLELAARYGANLEQQSGIRIGFHHISAAHARYFLQKSGELLNETPGERAIGDFLRFIGDQRIEDPFLEFPKSELGEADAALDSPYFAHWFFVTEELAGLIAELEKLEEGPIVLPPAKLQEMRHAAANRWLQDYFNQKTRSVWALAFSKAAFFLRASDFYQAQSAWKTAQVLEDSETPIDQISALAFLLEKSMRTILQEKKKQDEKEKETSLIISPAEFAAQQRKK